MRPGILTLTTDFGAGPYVASVKGIVLGLAPGTQLVDVSHTIAPQNILEGAFVLAGIVESFPPGTVHLAVVDPGVGTERRMIAVSVADQWFVAPDNGVLSGVVRGRTPASIRELTNPGVRRRVVSHTFHGRDVMAPAAAHLLRGGDPATLGPELESIITLANFNPRQDEHTLVGEVLFRDSFGNLITNIPADLLASAAPEHWTIEVAGTRVVGLNRTYGDQAPGSLIVLPGSSGLIEIAVVNGDAARHLTAGPGTTVWFRKT